MHTYDMNDLVLMGLARDSAYAEIDRLKERVAELEAWQEAAFIVHGNIDLDIDAHPEARAALKGKDDG